MIAEYRTSNTILCMTKSRRNLTSKKKMAVSISISWIKWPRVKALPTLSRRIRLLC